MDYKAIANADPGGDLQAAFDAMKAETVDVSGKGGLMTDEPISLKGRLEVQEFEFNVVVATVLDYVRRRNWEYIKENHPDVFDFVKEQIAIVGTD